MSTSGVIGDTNVTGLGRLRNTHATLRYRLGIQCQDSRPPWLAFHPLQHGAGHPGRTVVYTPGKRLHACADTYFPGA